MFFFPKYIYFKRFTICGYFVGGCDRWNIVTSSIYELVSRPVTSFSPMAACILITSGAGWAACILITSGAGRGLAYSLLPALEGRLAY